MSHIIVIGAGQAAASLTDTLRAEGFEGAITLIGAEPAPPYQRPPLSKAYLLKKTGRERLFLHPESHYADQRIVLRLGQSVRAIDTAARTVRVQGDLLRYDHLVLTTGSVPRHLPPAIGGSLAGVHAMRTLADADAIAPHIVKGGRVLIVGGGYVGLEAAAVCAQNDMRVTLVEAAPRILQRVAGAPTSDFFRALHTRNGVQIREGVGLERLDGSNGRDGRVCRAHLSDGDAIEVDMVIVGIGITPATHLARAAGIALDNGIAADAMGRTSAPDVWTAGDCASFPYREARVRFESVAGAIEQGTLVARNILGAGQAYVARPWFWSDQYDVKLQIAGLNAGHDRVVVRKDGAAPSHWYYAGDRLLAVDAMNSPRAYMAGRRLIEAGRSPDAGRVADARIAVSALMA